LRLCVDAVVHADIQIARSWWESDGYRAYFKFLDEQRTGFFSERWGDAPVRAAAAALLLRRDQVAYFGDSIGYRHDRSNWQAFCPRDGNVWSSFCDCSRLDVPNGHDVLGLAWYGDGPVLRPTLPWT